MYQRAKAGLPHRTLEHTHIKDKKLIKRIYACSSNRMGSISLLAGCPPVLLAEALPIIFQYGWTELR